MADKWEYISVKLEWEGKADQWTVTGPWGSGLGGKNLGEALNPFGEQGWELVSLFVNQWISWGESPSWYRAVFKRRKP